MGEEQSTPLSVEVKLEVDNGTSTLKEVNTSERKACEEHCECNGRKRRLKSRGQAFNGSSNHDVHKTSNGSSSGSSQGANKMGRSGRRKNDTSGERAIEVITLEDSSDGETF